jgi:hypothetical protein
VVVRDGLALQLVGFSPAPAFSKVQPELLAAMRTVEGPSAELTKLAE